MRIETIKTAREQFLDLLLIADPSHDMIMRYLDRGELFVLFERDIPYGVIHLDPHSDEVIEIQNIAIREDAQGQGYGKQLLHYAIEWCRHNGYKKIVLGTGNANTDTLAFYQKMGFRFVSVLRDYFVEQYDEPIFENGIQCRDRLMLELDLLEYV